MEQQLYFVLGWGAPVAAALFAMFLIRSINRRDPGTDTMQRISALIRSGAMAFLRTEYTVLAVFVALMFVVLVLFLPANAFLTESVFSWARRYRPQPGGLNENGHWCRGPHDFRRHEESG